MCISHLATAWERVQLSAEPCRTPSRRRSKDRLSRRRKSQESIPFPATHWSKSASWDASTFRWLPWAHLEMATEARAPKFSLVNTQEQHSSSPASGPGFTAIETAWGPLWPGNYTDGRQGGGGWGGAWTVSRIAPALGPWCHLWTQMWSLIRSTLPSVWYSNGNSCWRNGSCLNSEMPRYARPESLHWQGKNPLLRNYSPASRLQRGQRDLPLSPETEILLLCILLEKALPKSPTQFVQGQVKFAENWYSGQGSF